MASFVDAIFFIERIIFSRSIPLLTRFFFKTLIFVLKNFLFLLLGSLKILPKVFSSFLKCYWVNLDLSKANENYINSKEVSLLHIDYDKYSAEKDPAHGLFSGFFGKEWSDKYMKEFLFPLSVEDSNSLF